MANAELSVFWDKGGFICNDNSMDVGAGVDIIS